MITANTFSAIRKNKVWMLAASSILITLFLFFIDEGYYNFNWMKHGGNWIAFLVYVVPIFTIQLLMYKVVLRKYHSTGKTFISIALGTVIALSLVIGIILSV